MSRKQPAKKLKTFEEKKEYLNSRCRGNIRIEDHQKVMANYLNPATPYNGLIAIHGTGTGKTCGAIFVAEQFKEQIEKYHTKIYVIVPGPRVKEQWKQELVNCTGGTYIYDADTLDMMPTEQQTKVQQNGIKVATKHFYRIMTSKQFYTKVIGQKIGSHKKNGEYEREQSLDPIKEINNSLLIIDEAHNFTGSNSGRKLALRTIMRRSKNLKLLLLTATPMKNSATDIIDLLNFVRSPDDQVVSKHVFDASSKRVSELKFTPNGEEYLQRKATGYISYYLANDPHTFARKRSHGKFVANLNFTKVTSCRLSPFQYIAYEDAVSNDTDDVDEEIGDEQNSDPLNKKSAAVCNIVYPALEGGKLVPYHGISSLSIIESQLKNDELRPKLLKLVQKQFFEGVKDIDTSQLMYVTKDHTITGRILQIPQLKHFSSKFYQCISRLNCLCDDINDSANTQIVDKSSSKEGSKGLYGAGTAFIYSNGVKLGVKVFQECLNQNGYLEYRPKGNYTLTESTRHYRYNITYGKYMQLKEKGLVSEPFKPATYLIVTGSIEDSELSQETNDAIDKVFNEVVNATGESIKFIIGSSVLSEGITLKNVKQVHILEPFYHMGRIDQIIGRAIRHCKHVDVTTEDNPDPVVDVYKYCTTVEEERKKAGHSDLRSSEEKLYEKAEAKYALTKRTEYLLKQVAIDCPLNLNNNQTAEDMELFSDCIEYSELLKLGGEGKAVDDKLKHRICPSKCQFEKCQFKCKEHNLNLKYYDEKRNIYKMLSSNDLDWTTFYDSVASKEITEYMNLIRDMYRIYHSYTLNEINDFVMSQMDEHKKELFDVFFIYRALNQLMPATKKQISNFVNPVINQYNELGYLVHHNGKYSFQSLYSKERLPMYYQGLFSRNLSNNINVVSYYDTMVNVSEKHTEVAKTISKDDYDFDTNEDYYANHPYGENKWVGIVDKPDLSTHLTYTADGDVFKLRPKRIKIKKRRAVGLASKMGSVCQTSMKKKELYKIAKELGIEESKYIDENNRVPLCETIYERFQYLEKYNTPVNSIPKKVYLYIPINHPSLVFPLNLFDRVEYISSLFGVKFKSTAVPVKSTSKSKKSDPNIVEYHVKAKTDKIKNEHLLKRYNLSYSKGTVTGILR